MTRRRTTAAVMILAAAAVAAAAAGVRPPTTTGAVAGRGGPRGETSQTPTPVFDRAGRLWVAWVDGPHAFAAASDDHGRSFASPIEITRGEEHVDANGEARPKIAVGLQNELYVSWTRQGEQPFTGDIRFARSADGGRTFSPPITVNDDGAAVGHRFDDLRVAPDGTVYVFWIDKRDQARATANGRTYEGAALYYALSRDRGTSFSPNRKLKDGICECCRLAVDIDGGLPVVFWRDLFAGSVRDHALVRFASQDTPGPVARVTDDGWTIDACPHHGPSLSVSTTGTYHAVWFTGGGRRGPGVFYGRSTDRGRSFPEPIRLGSDRTFGHASVLARQRVVVLAWKEGLSPGMSVRVSRSGDDGRTWGAPVEIARTAGGSDHPLLLADASGIYVSWFTAREGLRLLPISGT